MGLSSQSFCQTDTKTASNQSDTGQVALPIKIVKYMAQDLVRYDACKEETSALRSIIAIKDSVITTQEALTLTLRKQNVAYQSTIGEFESIDAFQTGTIKSLQDKQGRTRRQRNALVYFSMALITALIIK